MNVDEQKFWCITLEMIGVCLAVSSFGLCFSCPVFLYRPFIFVCGMPFAFIGIMFSFVGSVCFWELEK